MRSKVIVVGGGAAGLIAAGQAALAGAEVIVIEKKPQPGLKLRITGKGRCNLTNTAPLPEFLEHFNAGNKFLRSSFSRFFSSDLIGFFNEIGIVTKIERGGRVFPENNDAKKVLDQLMLWACESGAKIQTRMKLESLVIENNCVRGAEVVKVSRNNETVKREIKADSVVVATGGVSYPATGSTGDGYILAESVGHTIIPPRPSLVPVKTAGKTAGKLQGLSLKNVNVKLLVDGRKVKEQFGEMLFTHFGLSGPIILTLSNFIVEAVIAGRKVSLAIDLKPALDSEKLDQRILRELEENGKKKFQNVLKSLLPRKLIPVCCDQTGIDQEIPCNQLKSKARRVLLEWLKDFRFDVNGYLGFEEAIITAGGISLKEINPKTMESKIVGGLYFAGEVLDIDADTGGYNLQAAFSTGWVAGRAAAGVKI